MENIQYENLTENKVNEYLSITKNEFHQKEIIFNNVYFDIKEICNSIGYEFSDDIINKLDEFTIIFKNIDNILLILKYFIENYVKYNEKYHKKKFKELQLKNEIENLKNDLIAQINENEKKEEELNILQKDYQEVIKQIDLLRNQFNDFDLNIENHCKNDKIEEKNLILNKLNDLKNNNDELISIISIQNQNLEQIKIENSNLKNKLTLMNKENEEKNQQISFLESKELKTKDENKKLKSKVSLLKTEIENLYNENTYLKSEVDHLLKITKSSNTFQNSSFDYHLFQQKKLESEKDEEEKIFKDKDNSINLKNILEEDRKNNEEDKNNINSNKINLTSKHIINSMKKDFKTLTRKRLELNNLESHKERKKLNKNLRSNSCNETGTSKTGNTMENYYLFDFLKN